MSTFPNRVHKNLTSATRLLVGRALVVIGPAVIAFATLTPNGEPAPPFKPLCVFCGELGGVDIVLNILLFVPLGIGLALVRAPPLRALLAMSAASVGIELLQFFVISGRDPTLRDVITNSVGGTLGFAIGAYRAILIRPSAHVGLRLLMGWALTWLALQTVAAYALVPSLTRSQYYGQIGRELGAMLSAFPGEIIRPTLDTLLIPDREISDERVRELLSRRGGALLQTSVIPRGCPASITGIVRIADAESREILVLAQTGTELIFGVRSGAERLRLRPIRYGLRNVFGRGRSCAPLGDTIALQARYSRTGVLLRSVARGRATEETVAPTLAEGWRLFLPIQTYVEQDLWSATLNVMWLFALMLPAGYWSILAMRSRQGGNGRANVMAAAFVLAILLIAFVAVPALLEVPAVTPAEWIAALSGSIAGASARRHLLNEVGELEQ